MSSGLKNGGGDSSQSFLKESSPMLSIAMEKIPIQTIRLAIPPFTPIDNYVSLLTSPSGKESYSQSIDSLVNNLSLPSAVRDSLSVYQTTNSSVALHRLLESCELLLESSYGIFMKNLMENPAFGSCLESFCHYRRKTYGWNVCEDGELEDPLLFRVDRCFFLLFARLFDVCDEKYSLISYSQDTATRTQLEKEWQQCIRSLKWLRLPVLMDWIAILSESNQENILPVVERWVWLHSSSEWETECMKMTNETVSCMRDLLVAVSTSTKSVCQMFNPRSKSSGKANPSIPVTSQTERVAERIKHLTQISQQVHLVVDILFTWTQFLQILPDLSVNSNERHSAITCAGANWFWSSAKPTGDGEWQASGLMESGKLFWEVLLTAYEYIVPLLRDMLDYFQLTRNNLEGLKTSEINLMESLEERLSLIQLWSLQAASVLLSPAFGLTAEQLLHDENRAENSLKQRLLNGELTWVGVMTHRLSVMNMFMVSPVSNENVSRPGSLVSDLLQYGEDQESIKALIVESLKVEGDISVSDTFISSLILDEVSLLSSQATFEDEQEIVLDNWSRVDDVSTTLPPVEPKSDTTNESSMKELIQQIQEIIPDLGEGFVEACLRFYNNKVEDVVEAILCDNLSPQLASLDRSIKAMWIGKSSTITTSSNIKIGEEVKDATSYAAMTDRQNETWQEMKATQKAFLRAQQERAERDAEILAREYNDDYDDQNDDGDDFSNPVPLALAAGAGGRGMGGGLVPLSQLEDVRRFNQLYRAELEEAQFWQDLSAFSNRRKNADVENDLDLEESYGTTQAGKSNVKSGKSKKTAEQKAPPVKSDGKGPKTPFSKKVPAPQPQQEGDSSQAAKKEEVSQEKEEHKRTKTFDKHRQKSASYRKLSGFPGR